jgi:hypothetical protein
MSNRCSFLLPLVLCAAPAAAGDRLLVAGADGLVMQADMDQGAFEYFACACSGPINALAVDRLRLYTADDFGQLSVYDVEDGALENIYFPAIGPINALAAGRGAVFAGTEDGQVVRIDPASGAVLDARSIPSGVRALLAHGRFLLAAGADGGVYRAPIAGGDFVYFTCFCFFDIQQMVVIGDDLFIVDAFGTVARADGRTGELISAFSVGATNSMAANKGTLLFYYAGAGGAITRFDADTGLPLSSGLTSPVDVRVMLTIPEPFTTDSWQIPSRPRRL